MHNPGHLNSSRKHDLMRFDRVIANPPFSTSEWGYIQWCQGDRFGRDTYGCPPAKYGDLAFVQHMIASLKENGKLAVVIPHGVLFRVGAEGAIRKALIDSDTIECVIGLAPNLFYGAAIPAAILIVRKQKPKRSKNKILIINGVRLCDEQRGQNYLNDDHIKMITDSYRLFRNTQDLCRVITAAEIRQNDYDLNISRYVHSPDKEEEHNLSEMARQLYEHINQRNIIETKVLSHLRALSLVQ